MYVTGFARNRDWGFWVYSNTHLCPQFFTL